MDDHEPRARRTVTTRVEVSSDRGVFMISVAAELAEMHPQTLRMYEARGLIEPKRSPKGTRLYSHRDVERLRRIQEMTAELGMNLAGVERVFELEQQLEATTRRVRALEKRAAAAGQGGGAPGSTATGVASGYRALHERWGNRAGGGSSEHQDPGAAAAVCVVMSWPVRVRRLSLVLVLAAAAAAALALVGGGRGAGAAKHATPASLGATAYTAAVGPAPGKARLDLELPLVANDAGLARFVAAVSDPTSPRYRQFASARTLARRFGAKPGVAAAVQRFLRRAGARNVALNPIGQFITATMTVAAAQRSFATRLARFRDARGHDYIAPAALVHAASAQPPLPAALRGRVTGVVGLDTENLATTNMHAALTHGAVDPGRVRARGHRGRSSRRPPAALAPASVGHGRWLQGRAPYGQLHPQPVPHRLRLPDSAQGQPARAGRARRADRDRRLSQLGHHQLRPLLPPARPPHQRRARRWAAPPAVARRRDDARPRDADRRRTAAAPHLRL